MSNQMDKEDSNQTKPASTGVRRWRVWSRVKEPSRGLISQPGSFGPFIPSDRDFGEDEYADFVEWVKSENQRDPDREHEIRAEC